jgi:WD repeat-containing protein 35
VFDA